MKTKTARTQVSLSKKLGLLAAAMTPNTLLRLLTILILAQLFLPAQTSTIGNQPAQAASESRAAKLGIPLEQIGARAASQYSGEGLVVIPSPDGARLGCLFQRLNAKVTDEGLWLNSIKDGAKSEPFRVVARALGRGNVRTLASSGKVEVDGGLVRFIRPGLAEEYSVGIDGLRQDFVIERRPSGEGSVELALQVDGANAEPMTGGARLILADSGRQMAYNRLKANDAQGHEVSAKLRVVSSHRLTVMLDDTRAEYPVRIDPTFSDANWVSLAGVAGVGWATVADMQGESVGTSAGSVSAAVVDNAGTLYVAGSFRVAGNVFAAGNIAKWDGSSWSALGVGVAGTVSALALDPSGKLYAAGNFSTAGGVTATNIALWNGSSWSALGVGIGGDAYGGTVAALACDASGSLYAAGSFDTAGGGPATNIARWDGNTWSALGNGVFGTNTEEYGPSSANAMAFSGTNLYVAGAFGMAGNVPAANIARWDGNTWSALGDGVSGGSSYGDGPYINVLAVLGTNLYVGGEFNSAGSVSATNIAEWNGRSWIALGLGVEGEVNAMTLLATNLYVGGAFRSAGGVPANNIAEWNGSSWAALGLGISGSSWAVDVAIGPSVSVLTTWGTNLFAGGLFTAAGEAPATGIAQWNGSSWSTVGAGGYGDIRALAVCAGNLYVGGGFALATVGGGAATGIAEWNGRSWLSLGAGISGNVVANLGVAPPGGGNVFALAVSGSNVYVGGEFTTAGGVAATNIALWNGSSWSALGVGIGGDAYGGWVDALACDASGNLYAAGYFDTAGGVPATNIARWDGNTWSALGVGIPWYGSVGALAIDTSGNLYAAGYFDTAGGMSATNIAEWNGSSWSALGTGIGGFPNSAYASALAFDSAGKLYAAGNFTAGGLEAATSNVALWNGSSWSALGSGMSGTINALTVDGAGNLYAAGNGGVCEWNGNSWSVLESLSGPPFAALAVDASGNLYVGVLGASGLAGPLWAGTNVSFGIAKALLTGPTPNRLLLANGGAGTNIVTYLGTPGANYALDVATNLTPPIHWAPQMTNTTSSANAATAGYLTFTNSNYLPRAYYRARALF